MTEKILAGLRVRPASADDQTTVVQICGEAMGGDDYVPYVWPEWASNPASQPFILDVNGKPAALYCLREGLAGPGSGWIQGVRVRPIFRQQGLAGAIIQHAIDTAREQHFSALRYVTALENTPMHRVAERLNFRKLGNFMLSTYPHNRVPVTTGLPYRLVTTSEFDGAYNLITQSPEYKATSGFYSVGWWWKPLSMACLREHIEQREVYTLTGALTTLAILSKNEDYAYDLSLLTGELQASQSLLLQLIKKVLPSVPAEKESIIHALLPQTPIAETLLPQLGFEPDPHEPAFTLYELNLGD